MDLSCGLPQLPLTGPEVGLCQIGVPALSIKWKRAESEESKDEQEAKYGRVEVAYKGLEWCFDTTIVVQSF